MDLCGFVSRKHLVYKIVNIVFADRENTVSQTVDINWIDNFMVYISTIKLYILNCYNYKYTGYKNPKTIQQ